MAFPDSFKFRHEADFIDRFLVPLIYRLGFSLVHHYHGTQEYGKDLIFGEIDRFGQVVYHALQAKYTPSISQRDSEGLIDDANQAFRNPFVHPITGQSERISVFYAVNGGDISDQAKQNYFNELTPKHGANVKLFSGKDLVVLDRWATGRSENTQATLSGLRLEIETNTAKGNRMAIALDLHLTSDQKTNLPIDHFRIAATNHYLSNPIAPNTLNATVVYDYATTCENINVLLRTSMLFGVGNPIEMRRLALGLITENYTRSLTIVSQIDEVLRSLGPLSL